MEKEICGNLRVIEFIYREAGVNRPLKPTDSKTDNQINRMTPLVTNFEYHIRQKTDITSSISHR